MENEFKSETRIRVVKSTSESEESQSHGSENQEETVTEKMSSPLLPRKHSRTNDVSLWAIKLHYFLHGAGKILAKNPKSKKSFNILLSGGSPIIPFMPVIAKQLGVPGSGIGFILGLVQVIGLILK